MPDWLIYALRVLVFLSLASGAYRGYKELRGRGPAPFVAHTVNTLLLLIYTVSATMLIIAYFAFVWPGYLAAFVLAVLVYVVGGFKLVGWAMGTIHRRFGAEPGWRTGPGA